MKKITIALVLAVIIGLAMAPASQARGDEALAFIGGVIVGSVVTQQGSSVNVGYYEYTDRYQPGHRYYDRRYDRHDYGRGQWVRVWVPGRWVIQYDRYGYRERIYVRGHYDRRYIGRRY